MDESLSMSARDYLDLEMLAHAEAASLHRNRDTYDLGPLQAVRRAAVYETLARKARNRADEMIRNSGKGRLFA